MEYNKLYDEFLNCFTEDAAALNCKAEELAVDTSDGMHVMFGMVIVPFLLKLIEEKNNIKLKLVFAFFEKMAIADDPLICEVLEFTILEDLISQDKDVLECCKSYMGEETLKSCQAVAQYMM